jgi:DNA-binding transcriptional MerR regulator
VYSIGEFSRITGLSIKTLRFYHEQGLLAPSWVDEDTGYRYYAPAKVEIAQVITQLRALDLPLADIAEIMRTADEDSDLLAVLERHRTAIAEKLRRYRGIPDVDRRSAHARTVQRVRSRVQPDREELRPPPLWSGVSLALRQRVPRGRRQL